MKLLRPESLNLVKPEVSSEVVNFLKEILSFLARIWLSYVGSGQLLFDHAIDVQIQVKTAVTEGRFSLRVLYE
jgi:hypothetical protein